MAVNTDFRFGPALRPSVRALTLLAVRIISLLILLAPAQAVLRSGLADGLGRNPFADPNHETMHASLVLDMLSSLPGAWLPMALAGGLLFVLWDQVLTAAALTRLDPADHSPSRITLWRQLWDDSARHFWPLLRILGASLIVIAVGSAILGKIIGYVDVMAQAEGWTAQARFVELRSIQAGATVVLMALVGSWAWLAKALTVLCERRLVRRTLLDATRIWWRVMGRWVAPFVLVTIAAQATGTALLSALYPPKGVAAETVVWLGYLVVQGCVWIWIVQAAGAALTPQRRGQFGRERDASIGLLARLLARRRRG